MDNPLMEAKKRVKRKKDFYKELGSFVSMSILLLFINIFTNPYYMWALWAIVPWGISIVAKGFKIYSMNHSDAWEQKEIRKELIAMGKDPEDYLDDQLELKNIEQVEKVRSEKYNDSDLV